MKKIGIVTCFLDNYGACLQAFSLQSQINKFGYETEILQYVEPEGYDNDKSIIHRFKVNCFTRWVRSIVSKNYRKKYLFQNACKDFRKHYIKLTSRKLYNYKEVEEEATKYDALVCGSDQIWNPTFYGKPNKVYYLGFCKGKKRIAYAPSIGVSEINVEYREEFKRLVCDIDSISVREKTGSELIMKYTNREAAVVLDPTLLINGYEWRNIVSQKKTTSNKTLPQDTDKYIFCYLFGDRPFYYQFINNVSRVLGLEVYIIPFSNNQENYDYHKIFGASPLDFVKLIANASLVITDSFHATAFSINMNTPFYTLLRNADTDINSMNSRVTDILKMVKLEDRLWNESSKMDVFTTKIEWNEPNSIIQEKRSVDSKYLEDALK